MKPDARSRNSAGGAFARKTSAALAQLRKSLEKLTPRKPALIAVSGGRDSVALLHFLVSAGWEELIVLHLNHGLRGRRSDADEKFVRELAAKESLHCQAKRLDVARFAKTKKLSIETAGREARRAFFAAMAKRHHCRFLFTAHHADDQAETVLHRLCRGTSLRGASGMRAAAVTIPGLTTVRPLLEVTRPEIDEYLAERRLRFRDDASNASPAHTRNRVRHELLPLMNDVFRRDVRPLLGRFAELAERDDACLNALSGEFAKRHKPELPDGSLRITAALRRQPDAISSRLVTHWLDQRKVRNIGVREIDSALAMLRGDGPVTLNLPGGAHLRCDGRRLWVEPPTVPSRVRGPRPRPSRQPS